MCSMSKQDNEFAAEEDVSNERRKQIQDLKGVMYGTPQKLQKMRGEAILFQALLSSQY